MAKSDKLIKDAPITWVENYQTKDYDLFVSHPYNRSLVKSHVGYLVEEMKLHGFKAEFPILVNESITPGKLTIVCGHHRFEAAKSLGISMFVQSTDATEPQVDRTLSWKAKDYLESYAKQGKAEYEILLQWLKDTMLPNSYIPRVLAGDYKYRREEVMSGRLKLLKSDIELLEATKQVFPEVFSILGVKVDGASNFIIAIIQLIRAGLYEKERFHKQFKLGSVQQILLRAQLNSVEHAIRKIEEMMNFRATEREPLYFKYSTYIRNQRKANLNSNKDKVDAATINKMREEKTFDSREDAESRINATRPI